MVQVQQQSSVYFCIKMIFDSWLLWLIWPYKWCLISMMLTMTENHENLLRESTMSLLSLVKFFSCLETKITLKIPNETLLRITWYHVFLFSGQLYFFSHYFLLNVSLYILVAKELLERNKIWRSCNCYSLTP